MLHRCLLSFCCLPMVSNPFSPSSDPIICLYYDIYSNVVCSVFILFIQKQADLYYSLDLLSLLWLCCPFCQVSGQPSHHGLPSLFKRTSFKFYFLQKLLYPFQSLVTSIFVLLKSLVCVFGSLIKSISKQLFKKYYSYHRL